MRFSEKISTLRKKHRLSQEELAEALDVSRQAVSRWEKGGAVPDAENLLRLSELFGITIDDLLKDDCLLTDASAPVSQKTPSQSKNTGHFAYAKAFLVSAAVLFILTLLFYSFTAELPALLIPALAVPLPSLYLAMFESSSLSFKSVVLLTLFFLPVINILNLIGFRIAYQMHYGESVLHLIVWKNVICFSNTAAFLASGLFMPSLARPKKHWVHALTYIFSSASICGILCALYSIVSDKSPSLLIIWTVGGLCCFIGFMFFFLLKHKSKDWQNNEKM